MGVETIIAAAVDLADIAENFISNRRSGTSQSMGIAVDTVELLQVQVATLTQRGEEKDAMVSDLRARVEILEGLVTQRAEVEALHTEVLGVRGIVEKIAVKVGV